MLEIFLPQETTYNIILFENHLLKTHDSNLLSYFCRAIHLIYMDTESYLQQTSSYTTAIDRQIVALLSQGDEDCVRLVFNTYYKPLCLYAARYLLSPDDIEDIIQSVIISLWRNHQGRTFDGSIRSYLYGAVAKASLKRMEEEQRYFFVDLESVTDGLIDELASDDAHEWDTLCQKMHQAIEALPERSREVLRQIIFQGLPYKEVAKKMSISVHTVRNHYVYALNLLRKQLDKHTFLLLIFLG